MGEVIADGWVEETVEAVDFAAPHDFGERQRAIIDYLAFCSGFPAILEVSSEVIQNGLVGSLRTASKELTLL
jgi:hypothetical protein